MSKQCARVLAVEVKLLTADQLSRNNNDFVAIIVWCLSKVVIQCSNQIFYYTSYTTPKRVTSWRGQSPRHCVQPAHLFLEKILQRWRAVYNTVCDLTGLDLKFWPPAAETNWPIAKLYWLCFIAPKSLKHKASTLVKLKLSPTFCLSISRTRP